MSPPEIFFDVMITAVSLATIMDVRRLARRLTKLEEAERQGEERFQRALETPPAAIVWYGTTHRRPPTDDPKGPVNV